MVVTGGRRLWNRVQADTAFHMNANPLEAWCTSCLDAMVLPEDVMPLVITDDGPALPLRQLAVRAGLGHLSRLGLVVHPELGPWIGIRILLFSQATHRPTGPLASPSPCVGCPAPCEPACPAAAISEAGWHATRCIAQRQTSATCTTACHARTACVIGQGNRYSAQQHAYHHDPINRRRWWSGSGDQSS